MQMVDWQKAIFWKFKKILSRFHADFEKQLFCFENIWRRQTKRNSNQNEASPFWESNLFSEENWVGNVIFGRVHRCLKNNKKWLSDIFLLEKKLGKNFYNLSSLWLTF